MTHSGSSSATVPPVAVIGAGGHAKVVLACLRELSLAVSAVYDDDEECWGREILGVRVAGPTADAAAAERSAVLAVGDNAARRALARRLDLPWVTVIHPRAFVDPSTQIGPGTVVFAGAVIQPEATVGAHVIVNTGASIDHDCRLGDFVHVAPGTRLAGGVTIGEGTLMGIASAAVPRATVGEWSVIGAGATVVDDLPDRVTAVGCPARVAR